jgi:hypothetical protein
MAAMYGVADLTGGEIVLLGANDSATDRTDTNPSDTDLQVAIVNGGSVNTVAVPLPAGASESSAYIGGAAVTALTNGNFAVLYWGSNDSDGALVVQGQNATLPNYYVQVFAPDGSKVGGLITLVDNGTEGNALGAIAEDSANGGFVVTADTGDQTEVVVQRYTNAGATSGASLSFPGSGSYADVVDSRGDILVQFGDLASGNPAYIFIPDGATSATSPGVLPDEPSPTGMVVTTDPSGGFIGFGLPETGTNLEAHTISTSGALGSTITLGNVGSTIAENDFIWVAVALSEGGYAMTLDPYGSSSITGYPALDQVITVGASLTAAATSIEDLTTAGGASAPVGPFAVADGKGGIATYTDIPDTPGDMSPSGFPLNASLSATTYLDVNRPTVSAGGTATFTAGGAGVPLDPTVDITDASSTTLAGARVAVGSGFLGGDQLSADPSGTSITATYNAGNGVLTLTGSDTVAHYKTVLDSVTYGFNSAAGDPTSGGTDTSRTIEWTVDDGTATSLPATSTVTVERGQQAPLTVTSTSGTYGTELTLTTGGGSGTGTVSFTATDGTASGCTVSGSSLSAGSAGTCTVTATKAGDADYAAASSPPTTVTFAKATQSPLTFTSTSGTCGTELTLTTGGGSGSGTVSFVATDGTASGCTVSGSSLSAGSAGTCTVTATKAGDADYAASSSAPTTVTFARATQAPLTVTSTDGTYGSELTLTTGGGSGAGTVSFTATDGTAAGCTVSGSSLSAGSAGTCTVTATKAGDADHEAVSSAPTTVTFARGSQTVAFTSTAPSGATVGATYEPSTRASSGLPVAIALDGSSTGCTLTSGVVSFTGPGLCVLDATQPGDADWLPAATATQAIQVTPAAATPEPAPATTSSAPPTSAPAPAPTEPEPATRAPKPKPKPRPEQHVTVRITGLTPGATYFGDAPTPRCIAQTNTGRVDCQITREVAPTTAGTTVTYTAQARGSAGAEATARVTVHIAELQLGGLHKTDGIYIVKLGSTYTLRVASRTKPLYVTAAVAPQPPAGTHDWFHRTGSANGVPVWTLHLYLHTFLAEFPAWNLGIKIGDKTQVLTIRT